MSKLDNAKEFFENLLDKIRESEAYTQLRARYEELDQKTKMYVQVGGLAGITLLILFTVVGGIAKVSSLNSDLNAREDLIGYLNQSADQIRMYKAQQAQSRGPDTSMPLSSFVESVTLTSGIDKNKLEIGSERKGMEDKEVVESLIDVKMTQTNLRQMVKFLFNLVDLGNTRKLGIKDLTVDTKEDPEGYIDVSFTASSYRPK